jgi:16S rRNA (guanine966-N2)-methyltransferase
VGNEVRIIAGRWRSRKLRFPAADELRPTPDRVRETLFNWLQGELEGKQCLDLYAGSGALGFEAASRGAERVVEVERDARVCAALRRNCAELVATQVAVVHADAFRFLTRTARTFDIVFLDPPFRRGHVPRCCELLESRGWLSDRAWIYIEAEAQLPVEALNTPWPIVRSQKSGDVGYHLCRRSRQ